MTRRKVIILEMTKENGQPASKLPVLITDAVECSSTTKCELARCLKHLCLKYSLAPMKYWW